MTNNIFSNLDIILRLVSLAVSTLFGLFLVFRFLAWTRKDGLGVALFKLFSYRILIPFVFVIGLSLLSAAVVFIMPQQVGVVVSALSPGGVRARPLRGGLHWIVPLVETVEHYPTYWQTYTMSGKFAEGQQTGNDSIRARTSDGQEVFLDTSLIFRINVDQAVLVHLDWQDRYVSDLIRPVARGFVRTQVSQFTVDEVNSSARKDLEETLDRLIREELATKGLILDQFLVRDITFSAEYAASVELKQVAQEDQARALFKAEEERRLAQGEADAILIRAQGQAAALELLADALAKNPQLITYEYVQKLSPNVQAMLIPNDNPFLLPLPELAPTVTNTLPLETVLPTAPIADPAP